MATVPAQISGSARGIVNTLDGYIIQNETIDDSDISEQTPDQNGAIADDTTYDTKYDLSFTVISTSAATARPAASGDIIQYGNPAKYYKVKKCSEAGTYNAHRRRTITAEAWANFPTGPQA